jgi:hypothetical protein
MVTNKFLDYIYSHEQTPFITELLRNHNDFEILYKFNNNSISCIEIFVIKNYIDNLCERYTFFTSFHQLFIKHWPLSHVQSIGALLKDKTKELPKIQTVINIEISDDNYINQYKKYFKLSPYNYQLNNCLWILEIENNVNNKTHYYDYYNKNGLEIYKINKKKYYYNKASQVLFNKKTLMEYPPFYKKFSFIGGALCDDVGIGKTYSFIYPIIATLNNKEKKFNNITLIICPKRLVNHWASEFTKFVEKINVTELRTIVDIKYSSTKNEAKILKSDVIICPISLLGNADYHDIL